MAPSNPYFYFSSPTVVLPPQQPHLSFGAENVAPTSSFTFNSPFAPTFAFARETKCSPWPQLQLKNPIFTRTSRKRSRDEMTFQVEHEEGFDSFEKALPSNPVSIPAQTQRVSTPYVASEGHETSTWTTDTDISKPQDATTSSFKEIKTPKLISRKSQRLDSSSIQSESGFGSTIEGSPPKSAPTEPKVDDFTLRLGIGWKRLSEDNDIQAAARGWARYIDNHFPVSGSAILLESKGLSSYLVGANEGFFLFSDDLNEGRLVGTDWDSALKNLGSSPVVFESAEVLRPAATPSAGGSILPNVAEPEVCQMHDEAMFAKDEPAGQEFSMDLD